MKLFDDVAERFARSIDLALDRNSYVRGELFLDMAQRTIATHGRVLDYGCGPGRLSLLLARAGYSVHGVDISMGMISQARALDRQDLDLKFDTIGDSERILQANSYDAIICSSVIEYVLDPDALLQAFKRSLRNPGVLIISYANASSLWRRYWTRNRRSANPMNMPHHHVWRWRTFDALLGQHGFQSIIGPNYFDSPSDAWPCGGLFRRIPLVGSLGVVAARPSYAPEPT